MAVETFSVGDKAVYPARGVTEVRRIDTKDIGGVELKFYVLQVLDKDETIMVPVNKVDSVKMRRIVSGENVEQVYDILRDHDVKLNQETWNRRYRSYVDKMRTGRVDDLAEVLRDLYLLKADKDLSFGEKKMLDTAKSLLVKELSIAKNTKECKIEAELESIFAIV